MPELKKLFGILVEKSAIRADGELALRVDHIIVQERTRSRLLLVELKKLIERRDELSLLAMRPGVHPNIHRYLTHVQAQVKAYEACNGALARHTRDKDELGGECVLMSWDRWATHEPGAVGPGKWPEGLEGPGVRGRGLRTETELDAWTTQPIDEALRNIEEKLKGGKEDRTELEKDRAAILSWLTQLLRDVKLTEEVMANAMLTAGLSKIESSSLSKSQMAVAMLAQGQGGFRRGHRFWW